MIQKTKIVIQMHICAKTRKVDSESPNKVIFVHYAREKDQVENATCFIAI